MRESLALIALVSVLMLLAIPASADNTTTISFRNMDPIAHENVQIFDYNASLLGTWNTTTSGIVLQPGAYIIQIQPTSQSILSDPTAFVQYLFSWAQANAAPILFILLCIGLLAGLSKSPSGRSRR